MTLAKIAITGGVASGKSTVCEFLEELGAYVVNADVIVHELLNSDADLGRQVIRVFGPSCIVAGKISRKILADKAFKDPKLLQELESIVHPAVLQRVGDLYRAASRGGSFSAFVVEIPLLFEIGAEGFYDKIVAVLSDEALAKKRFIQEGFSPEEYDLRMLRHIPPQKKALLADIVITNNGSLEDLHKQVIQWHQTLKRNQTL